MLIFVLETLIWNCIDLLKLTQKKNFVLPWPPCDIDFNINTDLRIFIVKK